MRKLLGLLMMCGLLTAVGENPALAQASASASAQATAGMAAPAPAAVPEAAAPSSARDKMGIVVEIKGSKSSASLNSLVDEFNSDPKVEQLSGVADLLEARLDGGYDIISRSSLRSMLKEQVLQQQSGLVQNEDRLAALAKLQGIKYLFVCSLTNLGSQYAMTFKVLDCTTGQIDRNRRIAVTGKSVDELINRIDYCLESIGMLHQAAPKDTVATLAVLPFELDPGVKAVAMENVQITRNTIIMDFYSKLQTFLVKSRKFNVVDRLRVDQVINESRMVNNEFAKPGQAKEVGQLLLADYLVMGKISRLEFLKAPINIEISGESSTQMVGSFKFMLQIVEVKSGQIVSSEDLKVVLSNNDPGANLSGIGTWHDFKDALFDRAATTVGNAIFSVIYPVKIAAVNGGDIILNRGEGAGISMGQHYVVMQMGQGVVDPDTGKSLGAAEAPLAEVMVVQLYPKYSVARLILPSAQPASAKVELTPQELAQIQATAQARAQTQVLPQPVVQAQMEAEAKAKLQAKAQAAAQAQAAALAQGREQYAKNIFAQLRAGMICRPAAAPVQMAAPEYPAAGQGW